MIKIVKKISFFLSLILLYLIVKEFLQLYFFTYNIHPFLAYFTIAVSSAVVVFYAIVPIVQILRMPKHYAPTKDPKEVDRSIELRMRNFAKNKFLMDNSINAGQFEVNEKGYNELIKIIEKECGRIRKEYVNKLFYSTAISQNGFIDAVLIFSASVNLIKRIFILYHGRVTNKDLWIIAKKVYTSIAIGGSESITYAAEEIYSKLATDSMKSIPFADKILGSIADGFVNAALLTRVSLITENYCKIVYITRERDLYPSLKVINSTTKSLVSEVIERIKKVLISESMKRGEEIMTGSLKTIADPVRAVFEKAKRIALQKD